MLENIINKLSPSKEEDFPDDKTLDHAVLKTVFCALTDIKTGKQNFSTSPYQYINLWENYLNSENKLVEKPEDIANEVSNRIIKNASMGLGYFQRVDKSSKSLSIISGVGWIISYAAGNMLFSYMLGGFFAGILGIYAGNKKSINRIMKYHNIEKDRVTSAIISMQDKVEQTINKNKNLLQYNKS